MCEVVRYVAAPVEFSVVSCSLFPPTVSPKTDSVQVLMIVTTFSVFHRNTFSIRAKRKIPLFTRDNWT